MTDIREVSKLAKSIGALTFVDNTFLTPLFQKPLELGADVVLHSATKFIAGHSDVTAGLAVVKDSELAQKLGFFTKCIRCYFRTSRLFSRTSRSKKHCMYASNIQLKMPIKSHIIYKSTLK